MKFRNPIVSGFAADPSICRVSEDYYIVNSTFEYIPGLSILHSSDLVNWEIIGYAIHRAEQMQFSGRTMVCPYMGKARGLTPNVIKVSRKHTRPLNQK